MDLETLRKVTYKMHPTFGASIPEEALVATLPLANAIETNVIERLVAGLSVFEGAAGAALTSLDRVMRVHAAVVAWRDVHKLKKGDELEIRQLLDLAKGLMELVGWYEPPKVALVGSPEHDEMTRRAIADFEEERKRQLDAEPPTGLVKT
jgi:hypothetical protein